MAPAVMCPTAMTAFAALMKLLLNILMRGLSWVAAGTDSALHQQSLIKPATARRLSVEV